MVERCPDKTEALGPIPSTRTRFFKPFLFMNNEEIPQKIVAPWWKDGLIVFIKVSGYIAVPVIVASYLGKYLDQKYNTGNLIFFILVGVAFLSTIYLIWKDLKNYKKKIDKEEKESK